MNEIRNTLWVGAAVVGWFCATEVAADHPSLTVLGGPAGPVTTITALPLPRGSSSVGVRAEYIDFDAFSDQKLLDLSEQDSEADVHSIDSLSNISLGGAFGLTDNLTLGLTLPYIRRENIRTVHGHHEHEDEASSEDEHEDEPPEVDRLGDSSGIGDATLYGLYRWFESPDGSRNAAVVLGVKTPTGKTSERSRDGEKLEADLQPGSGSWDPLLGAAFTWGNQRSSVDASVLYKLATEGTQDTDLGDVLAYNAAFTYSLTPAASGHHRHDSGAGHQDHDHSSVSLILELNGEWRGKEKTAGTKNPNSGGNLLYLSPGVRYSFADRWVASLSVGLPVATDLNGDQVEPNWRVIGGISAGF